MRWGKVSKGGRVVDDFINVRDFAPTFMEAAGLTPAGTMTGNSLMAILRSEKSGTVEAARNVMYVGKERHDLGRPNDWGYPVRAIRTEKFLYIRNYEADRWPAGNPETGYRNCDGSPTKSLLLGGFDKYYQMSFGKRPAEGLYLIQSDPDCVNNLAYEVEYAKTKRELRERMEEFLRGEGDPRALGHAEVFDTIDYTGGRRHAFGTWEKNH
jgi:hypothetical protein